MDATPLNIYVQGSRQEILLTETCDGHWKHGVEKSLKWEINIHLILEGYMEQNSEL